MPTRFSWLLVVFVCGCLASRWVRAAELEVAPPSDGLRQGLSLSPFYVKCIDVDGFAIVGSDKVSDYAIREAAWIVRRMLAGRDDILKEYDPKLARLLGEVFPDNDWIYAPPSQRNDPAHWTGFDRAQSPRFAWSPELLEWYRKYEEEKKSKGEK